MLRGNHAAKIDDKGRLKVPNAFRALIEEQHGSELFVTSLTGEYVRIYPMAVWLAMEEKLSRVPSTHPTRLKFLDRVNYFGQVAELDAQGRVLIHGRVRDSAGMTGEVDVLGQYDSLDVWNHER
ncbi:MAG: division/cell wall cluster transcriptional repressor MraZ, partial [Acidobacteria bacterium]|nr:division/cell wall cluster transcriptional repressor MraZ [Acidobacteriota bacterium]